MPKKADPIPGHFLQLDGLRAFAAISVIVQHFTDLESFTRVPVGLAGVWLFFVLSGFLITGILLKAKSTSGGDRGALGFAWRSFYLRRIVRIFPLYYGTLFLGAALALPGIRESFAWYCLNLANFLAAFPGKAAPPLFHFWSLSVEEQFYVVWPTVVLLAPRRAIAAASIGMIAVAPVSRFLMLRATGDWNLAQSIPPSCLDGLGAGALLALLCEARWRPEATKARWCRLALAAGVALFLADLASKVFNRGYSLPFAFRYTSFSLISLWLVNAARDGFRGVVGRVLEFGPLTYLGKISYGIYVFHFFIPSLVEWFRAKTGISLGYPPEPGLAQFAFITVASIAMASLSWYLMERPINDLKRFFPYARRRPEPEPAPPGDAVPVGGPGAAVNAGTP